jgi:hypothetical protein
VREAEGDGCRLEGLRSGMEEGAKERVLAAFFADVRHVFGVALEEVRKATVSKSAYEANRKFEGFEGSFASLHDFYAGAEATLKLGYPNPLIDKGILLEHTAHGSVTRLFVTPNYRLATCLAVEYSWADDPAKPSKQALDLVSQLTADRGLEDEEQEEEQEEVESGWATRVAAGAFGLSVVRGDSTDVDIDAADHAVTFRCSPATPCPNASGLYLIRVDYVVHARHACEYLRCCKVEFSL